MLRFGTAVIAGAFAFVALLTLVAGAHLALTEARPGAAVLGVLAATAFASVAALLSGIAGTLRRLEAGMARLEESMQTSET
ncbi:MAG: hypothetical protein U0166_03095 [Acidobacteriota bacterium]